ncbi:MFS transporter [Klebsiella michiganensis]|uniref:MFS transporter n=1 Tax=Klebsiella michiganensis TaxID=1134687 RepID=UPI0032D9C359
MKEKTTGYGNKSQKSSWHAILTLSISAIIFVTAELLPIGVLQEIGQTYGKSIGEIGLIVTGYAWVVAFSAISATSCFLKFERRKLIVFILMVFGISNIIVSQSSNIIILYIGRILGAFSHGIFWSIVGPLAVSLVSDKEKAKATSLVFGGIAIASVAVVPLATFISQNISWELSFLFIGLTGIALSLITLITMPKIIPFDLKKDISLKKVITRPYLRRTYPVTALAICGNYCAFTYIGLLIEKQAGFSHDKLPVLLLLFGISGVVGNFISGLIKDKYLVVATRWILLLMILAVTGFSVLPNISSVGVIYLMIIAWGAGICAITVTLQSIVLNLSADSGERASSVHVAMFNIGIGSGAFLGGVIINEFNIAIVALSASIFMGGALVLLLPKITLNIYE